MKLSNLYMSVQEIARNTLPEVDNQVVA